MGGISSANLFWVVVWRRFFLGGRLWGGSRDSQNLTTEMQVSGFVSGGDNLP